jgi:hypothetical protein
MCTKKENCLKPLLKYWCTCSIEKSRLAASNWRHQCSSNVQELAKERAEKPCQSYPDLAPSGKNLCLLLLLVPQDCFQYAVWY